MSRSISPRAHVAGIIVEAAYQHGPKNEAAKEHNHPNCPADKTACRLGFPFGWRENHRLCHHIL